MGPGTGLSAESHSPLQWPSAFTSATTLTPETRCPANKSERERQGEGVGTDCDL